MFRVLKTAIYGLSIVFMSVTIAAANVDKKVALVIGNQNYQSTTPLKNPLNDAAAITSKLEGIGFDVVHGTDLTYDALRDTVRNFTRAARTADVTLFYYAGHGIAVDGENYIVPVDAKLNDPIDWEFEVYNVAEILRLIDRSPGPSLVFLDACRDNPLADILAQAQGMSTRSLNNRGIARIPTGSLGTSGSVIAYATEPGQVAADGTGENSPFALALLDHIDKPNTDFASITSLITRDVMQATNGVQRPRFDVSLTGPLMLNAVAQVEEIPQEEIASLPVEDPVTPTPAAPVDTSGVEQLMFEAALASNDAADFEAFLNAFPNSTFAPIALNAVNRLQAVQQEETKQQEEQFAALDTTPVQPSTTRLALAPLVLTATPAALSMPSTEATDAALSLNRTQRKEVQLRLNLSGHNVGTPDGSIGPNSRKGIRSWQTTHGFLATGFLNTVQHQYLVAGTEQAFKAHLVSNPNALAAPAARKRKTSTSSSNSSRTSSKRNNNGNFWKGVAAGAGAAILLKKK